MELQIILWLQSMQGDTLDLVFKTITLFGDAIFVVLIGLVILFGRDKKHALRFFILYGIGGMLAYGLKLVVRRPRPYTLDGVVSIGNKTAGYSMPSGHSQSIANISSQGYMIARRTNNTRYTVRVAIVGIVTSMLVGISRMYLGQHYLSDVVAGFALGLIATMLGVYVMDIVDKIESQVCIVLMSLAAIVGTVAMILGYSVDLVKICGLCSGFLYGYTVESKLVSYTPSPNITRALMRILIGSIGAIGLYSISMLVDDVYGLFAICLAIGLWVSCIACIVFKKLGI